MAIGNRQIGWSQEDNLLWEISRQLDRINSIICTGPCPTTTTTTTPTPTTTTTSTTLPPTTTTTTSTTTCLNCVEAPVTIGTQTWTKCNLDVTTYRNGDPIPEVTDPAAWAALTTGAWCHYANSTANGTIYGKLYNWYAVNDPRGLAPIGQHIPTDAEWTTLTDFLGGATGASGKMKEQGLCHWQTPNTGAINSSGFTAFGAGFRVSSGTFANLNFSTWFWSSTENGASLAFSRSMISSNSNVSIGFSNKKNGLSIRCIID